MVADRRRPSLPRLSNQLKLNYVDLDPPNPRPIYAGALTSPKQPGSAYVLLHHIMGEAAGRKGVWAYVEGGMGAVSASIAAAAREHNAELVTDAPVKRILVEGAGLMGQAATGVEMEDGTKLRAKVVLSNATPYHTFLELMGGDGAGGAGPPPLPPTFLQHIKHADYQSAVFKINLAISKLPNFTCCPTDPSGAPGPQHRGGCKCFSYIVWAWMHSVVGHSISSHRLTTHV